MSDQFGNTVDREVWVPLKAGDWIDKVEIGSVTPGSQKPGLVVRQYAFAFADGSVGAGIYQNEGKARLDLMEIRNVLKGYGVDEEQWPVLMERTLETVASSWRILSV